jgi:hypothetical protein
VMDAARLKRHMPHKDAITQARAENVLSEVEKEIAMMRAELDRDTKKQEAA